MRKILKYLYLGTIGAVLLALLYIVVPYLVSPVYDFRSNTPFQGKHYYNPYQNITPRWIIANFHTHSKSWAGVTDGKDNGLSQVINTYQYLGYHHIGISNYQKITPVSYNDEQYLTIPTYEHGINVKKRHQLVLGADRVVWTDFFFHQNLHHKQFILNKLRGTCDFLTINHPQFCGGYAPQDFSKLSNYDAVEVFNHYRTSIVQWDSALSSGYYAVLLADDDMHNLEKMDELSSNFTVVNTPVLSRGNIVQSLKNGQHFGVRIHRKAQENLATKKARISQLVYPQCIEMNGDTLSAKFTAEVAGIAFIGQNGVVKYEKQFTDNALYVFDSTDTYIRMEVYDKDSNQILFNPIVRCEGKLPHKIMPNNINPWKSGVKYGAELLALGVLLWLFFRKKCQQTGRKCTHYLQSPLHRQLLVVVGISLLVRFTMAFLFELNNDELYYRLYAMFPHWSYFDHPPMVGWIINITTLHLLLDNPLFIRLGALLLCTVSSFLVFDIAKNIAGEKTGVIAVLLFNLSPYVLLVTGTFIIPDAGLMFFMLLAMREAVRIYVLHQHTGGKHFIALGLWIGLACLSKYTALIMWAGIGLYILIYDRSWLKNKYLYPAVAVTALCCMPILYWNIQHNFISFTYHGNRVVMNGIHIGDFFTELGGELLYNHPILLIGIWINIYLFFKHKQYVPQNKSPYTLIYCIALPFVLLFLLFALYKPILPHWNAPAYTLMLIPTAGMIADNYEKYKHPVYKSLQIAGILLAVAYVLFMIQFTKGYIISRPKYVKDYSIEIATCKKTAKAFLDYARQAEEQGIMAKDAPILCPRWELAANYEYHIARNHPYRILTIGPLYRTHEYADITHRRNRLDLGTDMWFITDNYEYQPPVYLSNCFTNISSADTIMIYRGNIPVKEVYIYRMQRLKRELPYIY